MRVYFFAALFSLGISSEVYAQLTSDLNSAKAQGITLYNQFKAASAVPFLELAAQAGDHEAQYYLGEALRKKKRYITPEAQSAYEASALQGDIYSMIRLSENNNDLCVVMKNCPEGRKEPTEWRKMALDAAEKEAAKGNAEAMYLMFRLTGDDKWLEQSAEKGYAFAQYYLATGYRDGKGFFLLPSSRADVVQRLMKASAEGGYPPGMMAYVETLATKNDLETLRFWYEKAAKSGYASAVFGYGSYLSKNPSELGFSYEPVKSYALISTLLELDGGGGLLKYAKEILPEIAAKLTPEQIEQAKQMSKEWKATHPPLSYFPDKL